MVKLEEYLNKIGIVTEALKSRVQFVYSVASEMCPEQIEEIFISDYIKDDGSRGYENVWFFSKGCCIGAKNFVTDCSMGIVSIKTKRIEVYLKDYDFKKPTEKSRLQLSIQLEEGVYADFKAAKENCDVLKDIVLKYFKPRLAE